MGLSKCGYFFSFERGSSQGRGGARRSAGRDGIPSSQRPLPFLNEVLVDLYCCQAFNMLEYVGRAVLFGLATLLPELSGELTKEMISMFIHSIASRPVDRVNP
jgi:hypothetical protein